MWPTSNQTTIAAKNRYRTVNVISGTIRPGMGVSAWDVLMTP